MCLILDENGLLLLVKPRAFSFSPLGLPQERLGRFRKVTVAVSDAHAQFDVVGPSL